jgi:hypothetical protein
MDKTSFGQNVQWDKTSSGTKHPRRQNVLKTKRPAEQNILREKRPEKKHPNTMTKKWIIVIFFRILHTIKHIKTSRSQRT